MLNFFRLSGIWHRRTGKIRQYGLSSTSLARDGLLLGFVVHIDGNIVGKEGLTDTQGLVDNLLGRLEVSLQLWPHHMLLNDRPQTLIVYILQE